MVIVLLERSTVGEFQQNQEFSEQVAAGLRPFSRRALLKGGTALALSASISLTLGCSQEHAVPSGLKVMTSGQKALFERLSQVLLPTAGTKMTPLEKVPVVENIDHLLMELPAHIRSDLGSAISLFDYGSLILGGHFSRFIHLNDADAIAYIDRWQNSNSIQRGIVTTLKKLVYVAYWRDESTWPPVEFDGPVSVRWGLPSLGNAPLPEA